MLYLFAAWTVFVWGTRIDNIVTDDGSTGSLVVAVGMTALGAAVVAALLLRRPRIAVTTVVALAAATVVVWSVRAPMILVDGDRSAPFKLVHAGLAVVSVALAVAALRQARRVPVDPAVTGSRPAPG